MTPGGASILLRSLRAACLAGRRRATLLWQCNRGVASLEFALIALPLIFMIFAIFEVGLLLKCRNDLDLVTQGAVRKVMVGSVQSQYQTLTADQFKYAYICPNLPAIFSCDKLVVNATMFDESTAAGAGFYTFVSGNPLAVKVTTTEQTFCMGNGGNYIYLQVAYPAAKLGTGINLAALLSGSQLSGYLVSSAAFRNEPFSNSKYIIPAGC